MAALPLSPFFGVAGQLFDDNGNPLAGGRIESYLAGTNTNAPTFTTNAGTIAHSNPIVLDGAGRVPGGEIWLSFNTSYKFVVKDSAGVLIGTFDNISGSFFGNTIQNYTGNGVTTSFALPVGATAVFNVYINGVYQNRNTYSISSGNLVFSEAPPLTSIIEVQV
jgi:hypothetical protein